MYISATKSESERQTKTIMVYSAVSIFCMLFAFIYEQFSYGEHSNYMRMMFCVPFIGGIIPFLTVYLLGIKYKFSRIAYNLWNSGVAVLTCGCLIRGIIEISGRTTDYDVIYWVLGGILLMAAAAMHLLNNYKSKKQIIKTAARFKRR